jgi:hypothetical protein
MAKKKSKQEALRALAVAHGALPPPESKPAGNKYKVSPVEERTWEGAVYASKLEMKFHQELLKHFRPDQIHLQVAFQLQEGFRMSFDQEYRRPIRYVSDFVIGEPPAGNSILPGSVVIDSKGFKTPSFLILKKLFEYVTGHPLWLIKSVKALNLLIPQIQAMQTSNQNIIKTLTGNAFIVLGYSSSDGTVSHKKFRIIGREGYLRLVQESLDRLHEVHQTTVNALRGNPSNKFTDEMMVAGAKSLEESLRKKLDDREPPTGEAGQITPAIGYFENKVDHLIVLRLEELEVVKVVDPEKKTKKPTASAFKALLEEQLPIHRYVHRINLYPGKYQDVQPA